MSRDDRKVEADDARAVPLFLCGDVMTGRGIDHILAHPSDSQLFEPYIKDAGEYVALAEAANGPVPRPARDAYIWGDALAELAHRQPRASIANLETSITRSPQPWSEKDIHYRMNPDNAGCLTAARFDACALANNHVLDFGFPGLRETLDVLAERGIKTAGAGEDEVAAQAPAVLPLLPGSHLALFACGTSSSGIPPEWGASHDHAGVDLVRDLSKDMAAKIGERIRRTKQRQDIAVVSIHWGGNWGYDVPASHRRFAHWLIDEGADLIHGHSSHHPRPIEIYRERLILYGCGDFLNDYEGITGYEEYRDDLVLMYFPTLLADSGKLIALSMVPMQIRNLSLRKAAKADAAWLKERLARVSAPFGVEIDLDSDAILTLCPQEAGASG